MDEALTASSPKLLFVVAVQNVMYRFSPGLKAKLPLKNL